MIDPELFKKKDKIIELRNKLFRQGLAGKRFLEKWWYFNILLFSGKHWMEFDRRSNSWKEIKFNDYKEYPVTNKFAVAHNVIKTTLTQKEPRILVKPELNTKECIATAEIADIVVDVVSVETNMPLMREIAATWGVSTGNAFFINYYEADGNKYGETFINYEKCLQCGAVHKPDEIAQADHKCPDCGADKFEPAMDEHLQAMGEMAPKGKLCCEVASGFEMFFNAEIQDFSNLTEIMRRKSVPIDIVNEQFPELQGKAKEDTAEATQDNGRQMLRSLAYSSPSGNSASWIGEGGDTVKNALVDYIWALPCKEFPDGLMATIVGDQIAELTELKYETGKKKKFIPVVHFLNERVAGRVLGKTKLDDIAKKQIDRNKLEAYIILWVYTMAAGKWLDPGTEMDTPDGDPNQVMQYTPGVDGTKPERVQGLAVNPSIYERLAQIDAEIEDLAGVLDVLKGDAPQGVKTTSGIAFLNERAVSRHNEMIDNWERALQQQTIQQIEILRQFGDETRTKTFKNDMGSWETKEFTNADLAGGLEISVEKRSSVPKSKALENQQISDSIAEGIIDVNDPNVRYKILEKRGQTDLMSNIGDDIKDAQREWKDFVDGAQPRYRAGIDNEAIHYADAVGRAKSQEFFSMPPEQQQAWLDHVAVHKAALDAQMAQQSAMEAGPQPQQKKPAPKEMAVA